MNAITKTLLGGAALGAIATAPAVAGSVPHFSVMALHGGHAVNKTRVHDPARVHLTYTFDVSTYVPASDLRIKTNLPYTFYTWLTSNGSGCPVTDETIKIPKRSMYAKLGWTTETYSVTCNSRPSVFYGDTYKLTDPAGEGETDRFVSTLIGKFRFRGTTGQKYKGTMHLDVSVAIGE